MTGRGPRADEIPRTRAEAVGANIQILRQRNRWTQAHLGQLMVWPTPSSVCDRRPQ